MATKAEALAWLATQPPINAVGTPKLMGESDQFGDHIYSVNVRKVNALADTARYENIEFVVVDEGGPGEICYFLKNNTIAWDNEHENPAIP